MIQSIQEDVDRLYAYNTHCIYRTWASVDFGTMGVLEPMPHRVQGTTVYDFFPFFHITISLG